jgi:hypothetical protein
VLPRQRDNQVMALREDHALKIGILCFSGFGDVVGVGSYGSQRTLSMKDYYYYSY